MISVASHGEKKKPVRSISYVMKRLVVGTCAVVIKLESTTSRSYGIKFRNQKERERTGQERNLSTFTRVYQRSNRVTGF